VCSFNLQICIFLKVQRLRNNWGLACLCATVGFPALRNPWIPGSVNKPRYFLSSAWSTDAKAFCKSFSIATWLLWRTLQTKVPDDIACCGLGSNCAHTHTHMNNFLLIYTKEGKVQESNFYHDCCNAPLKASTHPHQFDYFCYVLLESLNIS
jgi:hypothetical protein